MKSKNLALTNGIVGLAGGIILLFGIWFMVAAAAAESGSENYTAFTIVTIALYLIKIAILALGIIKCIVNRWWSYFFNSCFRLGRRNSCDYRWINLSS